MIEHPEDPPLIRVKAGWAEPPPPEACPACGAAWRPRTGGHYVVGNYRCSAHRDHREFTCLTCLVPLRVPELVEGLCYGRPGPERREMYPPRGG